MANTEKDYNSTINLPGTDFAMRANLPAREPVRLEAWESGRIYDRIQDYTKGRENYVLHDGPPYANGDIHLGTALNKILKDIVVKHAVMSGKNSPYVPGWDCHGLPIELKAVKKIGLENTDVVTLRKACREFAESCLDDQKKQFKRLGVFADYDNPYLTISPSFEARQVEVFGQMAQKGLMYKGLKPVCWCPDCKTALAEAEIEYADDPCYSIYVKFPVVEDGGILSGLGIDRDKAYVVIWTTTTWTLPGNLAICLGPAYEYTFINSGDEYLLVAKDLADSVAPAAGAFLTRRLCHSNSHTECFRI
ncbi:hypothetical protein FACS1894120_3000 [Clostridia bacterium]|nr:hypothetical protein FACS1894120_3000 [Clostridia bacterium]